MQCWVLSFSNLIQFGIILRSESKTDLCWQYIIMTVVCVSVWGEGVTNDVFKFRKITQFGSLSMKKDHLWIKKVAKNFRNYSKIKTLNACSNSCQFLPSAHMYRWALWTRVKTKKLEIYNNCYFLLFVWV